MVDSNKNIMWVVGKQGTGKTTMLNFLREQQNAMTYLFDSEEKNAAFIMVDKMLNDSHFNMFHVIIFSQEAPPEMVNSKKFNPILIKLQP